MRRVWILGANDPEMVEIEVLLIDCGELVAHALNADGERVTPRTAYAVEKLPVTDGVYYAAVECWGPAIDDEHDLIVSKLAGVTGALESLGIDAQAGIRRFDHHRPGDPGFGFSPERFLEGSSLGQVIVELGRLNVLPAHWPELYSMPREPSDLIYVDACWWVRTPSGYRGIPRDLVITAACDHCLAHAWAGRCPGVTCDDVRRYRARMAKTRPFEPKSEAQYAEDFSAAVAALREADTFPLFRCACGANGSRGDRGLCDCGTCGGQFHNVVDLRGQYTPELPDAACYLGIAYLAGIENREGTKIILGGATSPELVEHFIKVWGPENGLTGIYGDPARGFAGGYTDVR